MFNSKFNKIFQLILEEILKESIRPGTYYLDIFCKNSTKLFKNLKFLKIFGHGVDKNFNRFISFETGQNKFYEIIDILIQKIYIQEKFKTIINIDPNNRFCGLIKIFDTEENHFNYFKFILAFNKNKNLICTISLITVIQITEYKYNQLIQQQFYIDSNGIKNYIIPVNI